MTTDELEHAFALYFSEMDGCSAGGLRWALLHLLLVLPDICAALESADARTNGPRYVSWCRRYFTHPNFTAEEVYGLRCRILHQGHALGEDRYKTYSFATSSNASVHRYVTNGDNITLDPAELKGDLRAGMRKWFADLQQDAATAAIVQRNLPSLARKQPKAAVPGIAWLFFTVYSST